jgi:hypothetical protein
MRKSASAWAVGLQLRKGNHTGRAEGIRLPEGSSVGPAETGARGRRTGGVVGPMARAQGVAQ